MRAEMTSLVPKLCILINFFAIKIYLCHLYYVVDHCPSIHRSKRIFSLHFCYNRSHHAKQFEYHLYVVRLWLQNILREQP